MQQYKHKGCICVCVYNRMFNDFVYGNYTSMNTLLSYLPLCVYLNAVDVLSIPRANKF